MTFWEALCSGASVFLYFSLLAQTFPGSERRGIINRQCLQSCIPFPIASQCSPKQKYTWEIFRRLQLCIFSNVQRCRWWIPKVPRHWGHWKKLAPNSQELVLLSASLRWTCSERKSIAGGLWWSGNTFPQAMFGCDARLRGPNVDSVPWLHSPGIQIILEGRVNTSYFTLSCLELGNC